MTTTTVKGIVLRDVSVGEYDKILTVLTHERGKLSVYAGGSKKFSSKHFAACQLYAYSELAIRQSGEKYYLWESSDTECFFGIRDTLGGAALAAYIAEVALDISLEEQPEDELMRLVLNCFYCISKHRKPDALIKAVFELRLLCSLGFMPDLIGCAGCGKSDSPEYFFDVGNGCFRCPDCYHKAEIKEIPQDMLVNELEGIYAETNLISPISQSALAAMRYAVYSPVGKMFSFSVKDEALSEFSSVCEKYLLCHLERSFPSLDFYKTVCI